MARTVTASALRGFPELHSIYTLSPRKTAEYVRKTAVFRESKNGAIPTFRHPGTLGITPFSRV
ncbi:hypothetical protein MCC01947_09990 [Bifidobacteriaceae bacterium MCC01947]|nr:hypothetical protein MCC01947_09990 [Bifidobacteriaceae bacterium MCC01947]GDZ01396.1 hypothetical protein MCC01941_06470 [Bifidobacteriaceae bacterium MCC01941]